MENSPQMTTQIPNRVQRSVAANFSLPPPRPFGNIVFMCTAKMVLSFSFLLTTNKPVLRANKKQDFWRQKLKINLLFFIASGFLPRSINSCLNSDHFGFYLMSPALHIEEFQTIWFRLFCVKPTNPATVSI